MVTKLSAEAADRGTKSAYKKKFWHYIGYKIFKRIKYLRLSKQFVNTYACAYILIFFFTVNLFKISDSLASNLVRGLDFAYILLLKEYYPKFSFKNHSPLTELWVAIGLATFFTYHQLYRSIENFKNYVKFLHTGGFKSKRDDGSASYINLNKQDQNRSLSATMTSQSLHFPGYLIAHLVYGYFIVLIASFIVVFLARLVYLVPTLFEKGFLFILPVMTMLLLKILSLKFLTRKVIVQDDRKRITNINCYYLSAYFNFFFDCFLGFVACMSRVMETTVVSLFFLPRLDITIFNAQNKFIMKWLDKGHLAYINFVHMEHHYNNPALNAFCELMLERLYHSFVNKRWMMIQARQLDYNKGENEGENEGESEYGKIALKNRAEKDTEFKKIQNDDYENMTEKVTNEAVKHDSLLVRKEAKFDNKYYYAMKFFEEKKKEKLFSTPDLDENATMEEDIENYQISEEDVYEDGEVADEDIDQVKKNFNYNSYRKLCNLIKLYVVYKHLLTPYGIDHRNFGDAAEEEENDDDSDEENQEFDLQRNEDIKKMDDFQKSRKEKRSRSRSRSNLTKYN